MTAERPPDWWDRLYEEPPAAPEPREVQVEVNVHTGPKRRGRQREEILEAGRDLYQAAVPKRVRADRLLHIGYNGTAAYTGHLLGLVSWMREGMTRAGAGDPPAGVWLGIGLVLLACLADWRGHRWRGPDHPVVVRFWGWWARVPLASAVLALALYTT